jgi:dipeptidyl aminopeptidase/acylaminoacyl peptidase
VREGESLDGLFSLDLETHKVEKLYGHAEVDIDRLVRGEDGRSIVGVRVYTDRPEYHWLVPDDPVAVVIQALQRSVPGQSVSLTSLSRDGRRGIAFVSSDVNPGHYFIIDTETMQTEHFAPARRWIDAALMRPKEPIALSARDGLPLRGYITQPAGEGPHPLVVLPHGGPHQVRDDWAFDPEVQLLASRGYAVLQVNFRGSSGYGMDFEAAGYREWGGRIQDDIADATRWAVAEGIAEEGRICIYGSSFGGYSALMSAVREPGLYQCVVAFAGVYDLELMFSSGDIPRSRLGRTYLDEVLGRNTSLLRENSPVNHAERLEAPVLLIHGRDDWRADVSHARSMKAALEKAQKPHEWLELRREGHGIYDDDLRKETYERILAFLGQHLAR